MLDGGVAAVSNLRKFSSGGYRYPNRADLLVLFRIILLSILSVGVQDLLQTATKSNDRPVAYSIHDPETR
jgi:hypothetical protein